MCFFLRVALIASLFSVLSDAVSAQSLLPHTKTATLSVEEAGDFATFVKAARRETGASFLVEDAPMRPRLSGDVRNTLKVRLAAQPSTAARVAVVADLYDFEVVAVTPRFFVWRKRYTDAQDIPNVSYAETRESIAGLYALFRRFADPDLSEEDSLFSIDQHRAVIPTLSPEQMRRANDKTGLPVRDLTPEQKARFFKAVMDFTTILTRQSISNADYYTRMFDQNRIWFAYAGSPSATGGKPSARNVAYFHPFGTHPASAVDLYRRRRFRFLLPRMRRLARNSRLSPTPSGNF
jgi:hypothetical protein